jgi:hypothetical protein
VQVAQAAGAMGRQRIQDGQAAIERAIFHQASHDTIVPQSGTWCKFDCMAFYHPEIS